MNLPAPEKPPSAIDIFIAESTSNLPAEEPLRLWCQVALDGNNGFFALRIIGKAEMAELNGRYANKPKATNVLSFALHDSAAQYTSGKVAQLPQEVQIELDSLGDIAVCYDVVADEAREQGKTLAAHWAHMIIHGVLHLRGYDHIHENDAQIMESEEVRLLATLGFDNPYSSKRDSNNPDITHAGGRPA